MSALLLSSRENALCLRGQRQAATPKTIGHPRNLSMQPKKLRVDRRPSVATASGHGEGSAEFDPLRDSPIRFLGYSNEVGEAFGMIISPLAVASTYGVAIAYVLTDTVDKFKKSKNRSQMAFAAQGSGEAPTSSAFSTGGGTMAAGLPVGRWRSAILATYASESESAAPAGGSLDKSMERKAWIIGALTAVDTVVWQMLASVMIPGFIIHQCVHALAHWLESSAGHEFLSSAVSIFREDVGIRLMDVISTVMPIALGLGMIPFIAHPIDEMVDKALDATIRPKFEEIKARLQGGEPKAA